MWGTTQGNMSVEKKNYKANPVKHKDIINNQMQYTR